MSSATYPHHTMSTARQVVTGTAQAIHALTMSDDPAARELARVYGAELLRSSITGHSNLVRFQADVQDHATACDRWDARFAAVNESIGVMA